MRQTRWTSSVACELQNCKIHILWTVIYEVIKISIKSDAIMMKKSCDDVIFIRGSLAIQKFAFLLRTSCFSRLDVNTRTYSRCMIDWLGIDLSMNSLMNMKLEWAIHELMCIEYEYIAQYSKLMKRLRKKWNWMNWALRWKLCWKCSSILSWSC